MVVLLDAESRSYLTAVEISGAEVFLMVLGDLPELRCLLEVGLGYLHR